MGVLACSRRGCENIMCDRYSRTHGYICDECFKELINSGVTTDIEKFMESAKNTQYSDRESALQRFDNEFSI